MGDLKHYAIRGEIEGHERQKVVSQGNPACLSPLRGSRAFYL
jgi:hypothetical protein